MDPLTLTLVLGGAILLAASGGKKKKRGAPVVQEPDPEQEPPGPPPPSPDVPKLNQLGYGTSKTEVSFFQKDFNTVQEVYGIWDRKLKVDGIVGTNTRGALDRALAYEKERGIPWLDIVHEDAEKKIGNEYTLTANDKGNLNSLGYLLTGATVARFQKDFNGVNLWLPEPMLPMTLAEDGIIGPNTREAIAEAQGAQMEYGEAWMDMVFQSGVRGEA